MNPQERAILAFTTDDDTRGFWQHFAQTVDIAGQRWLYATDGHRLHACRTELDPGAYGMDGPAFADCRAPKQAMQALWPKLYGGSKAIFRHERTVDHIADHARALVVYTDRRTHAFVSLLGNYVLRRQFSAAEEKRLRKAKLFDTADALSPGGHLLGGGAPDGPEMPRLNVHYLLDAITWAGTIVHYTDAVSPVLFASKDRFAIVMPVRR